MLGKRTRGAARHGYVSSPSSDTDPDVGEIPMPRDTPPPLPRWRRKDDIAAGVGNGMNGGERQTAHVLPEKLEQIVPPSSQAVYESKPVLRDLRKEAAAFVPAAVAARRRLLDSGAAPLVVEEGDESCSNVIASQPDHDADLNKKLQEEEERWRRETKQVTIEDVNDEDT